MINTFTPSISNAKKQTDLKNLAIPFSALLLVVSNALPANANYNSRIETPIVTETPMVTETLIVRNDCNPGLLGLCTDKDPVAQICNGTSVEKKVWKCLPPNTVQLIITPKGMFAFNAQGEKFVIDPKYIGQFIRSDENGRNFIMQNNRKVRVTYYNNL